MPYYKCKRCGRIRESAKEQWQLVGATCTNCFQKDPWVLYEGPVAADMVATVTARGSVLTAEDFARHRGEVVAPITTRYRDLDLLELPPNGQGLTALVLLNILERFDLAALDANGPDRFHIMLEAARMAYAVRDTHIADPAFMRASVPRSR